MGFGKIMAKPFPGKVHETLYESDKALSSLAISLSYGLCFFRIC
jgi:hypothetical protein